MAANPYDAIVRDHAEELQALRDNTSEADIDTTPEAHAYATRYNELAARAKEQERIAIKQNLIAAQRGNADGAAEAQNLERSTGVPAEVAARNLPAVREKAALNQYDKLLSENPELATALRDRSFATVAHDDLENLSALQRAGKFFARAGDIAYAGLHDLSAGTYGIAQSVSEQLAGDIDRLLVRPGILPANPAADAANFFARKRQNDAAYADQLIGDMSDAGVIERGAVSGVRSLTTNLPVLAGAVVTKNPRAALTGLSSIVFGSEYGEARDQGLSPNQAVPYALSQAAIEYATERLPVSRLFGDLARGSGLLKTILGQIVTEIPGEQLATVGQDLVSWAVLPENTDATFADYLAARPSAAAETLVATLIASYTQTTAVHAVDAAARRIAGESATADRAIADAEQLAAINKQAAESRLRERAPSQFKRFLEDTAPDSDLYIDAGAFTDALAQSGFDPDALPAEIAARLDEAASIEGDVRLSVAEFATTFAGKPGDALVPHLRTSLDGMSLAESQSFAQSGRETFEADAAEAVEADAIDYERRAGTDSVKQAVRDQLDVLGRFNDDANAVYAELTGAWYETMAGRLGTTAAELYAEFPLNIVAESPLAPAFSATDQRGAYDPNSNTIALLRNADLSTYVHESGHMFLQGLEQFAAREGAPAEIGNDLNTLLQWFGVSDLATWQGMDLEARREHHEKLARGFEAYTMAGKAPSAELQAVFQRLRDWMLNVYRTLRGLNVELSDEVRAVFNRMLASESQITEAETMRSYQPIFESAEQAGMTPEDFANYQRLGAQATVEATEQLQKRSLNDLRWFSNAKGRVLKALQKDAGTKRKAIREEVAAEVAAEPIYRARRFLATGEIERDGEVVTAPDHKLSLEVLNDMYPEGGIDFDQLTRGKRGVTKKGGLHPDTLAELLGFDSGDQLVKALEITPPISDTIEALTDQRMLETYGDLTDRRAMERAAESSLSNDLRARVLATEHRALTKSVGPWLTLVRGATDYSRARLSGMRIRDVIPHRYVLAERKASRAAAEAFRVGDTARAGAAKRTQLIANRMGKQASAIREEVETGLRNFRRYLSPDAAKRIDPEYLDQIHALLERHDLRKSVSNKELERRASLLSWIEQQRDAGFEPEIDDRLLAEAGRKHYRDLTVEEFRGLRDAILNVEHLGRLKKRLLTAKDEREFGAAVDAAEESIRANATTTVKTEIEQDSRAWARFARGAGGWLTELRKLASLARQMDGVKDGGTMWELFIRPLNAAADREATLRAESAKKLAELFKPIKKLHEKTHIDAIGQSLSREARLVIALNQGNATNRQRVMEGHMWSEGQVRAVLDTLTKDEWNFVQNVWNYIDSFWPDIESKQRRVTGIKPEKVEAAPVQTQFGEYKGGYYPIKYDPRLSTKAESDASSEILKQMLGGAYTRASTRRGHTKSRVESVQRPMRLDLNVIAEHIGQVTHDLAYHEYLIDANRLLRAKAIDAAIRDHYGPDVLRLMRNTLEDIAKGDVSALEFGEKLAGHLRVGSTIVGLGLNLSTAALQVTGAAQSIVRIGPQWFGRGLSEFATRPIETVRTVYEKSEMMRNRGRLLNREVGEILNTVRGQSRLTSAYFMPIQVMQAGVDIPTWMAAYHKAAAEGHDDARAIALADQSVLDSQGGGAVKDLAAVQRGGQWKKLWTNFYSYFNVTWQLSAESVARYRGGKKANPANVARLATDFLLLYSVPAVLGLLLRDALRGDLDDDELPEKLVREHLAYLIGVFPYFREIGSAMQGYSYSGPSGGSFFAELNRLWTQGEQGEVDESLLRSANKVAGIAFHLPAGQVQRTAEGVAALMDGEAPLSAILFGPPRED